MRSRMIGLFAVLLGIDEILREYVEENLEKGEERKLLGNRLRIRKVYNRGLAFNRMEKNPAAVRNVSLTAGILVFIYWISTMFGRGKRVEKLGSTMLAAGAAGNLYDRAVRGHVIDYIGIQSKSPYLTKLTANLADLYLVLGSILTAVRRSL